MKWNDCMLNSYICLHDCDVLYVFISKKNTILMRLSKMLLDHMYMGMNIYELVCIQCIIVKIYEADKCRICNNSD